MHVLYIKSPPGFRHCQMSESISRCLSWHMATFAVLHSSIDCGSLRNIPSPEHGASQMIRSNMGPSGWKSDAQLFVTIVLGLPHLVIFSASMLALCLTISLAISTDP